MRCSAARRAQPDELLTQRHMDLAASIQAVTEEVVLRLTRSARRRDRRAKSVPGRRRRAQLRRQRQGPARRRFESSGSSRRPATPAARSARRSPPITCTQKAPRLPANTLDAMQGGYLGPALPQAEIERRLRRGRRGLRGRWTSGAARRDDGGAGRGKGGRLVPGAHGVRARARLGNRSILGDPRSARRCRRRSICKVKYRESFRPFAPSVLREDVPGLVRTRHRQPVHAARRRCRRRSPARDDRPRQRHSSASTSSMSPRSEIPAVTHVDYSARIQTVHRETNPRYHALSVGFQGQDRLPGAGQHQLQRARRADRLHAGGCVPLLHGQRDRGAGRRRLLSAQGAPGPGAEARLPRTSSIRIDQRTFALHEPVA